MCERVTNSVGMIFIRVSAGSFLMVSPEKEFNRFSDERQFRVTIRRPFYVGTTTVTNSQYRTVLAKAEKTDHPDKPQTGVTWDDAVEFCQRLSELAVEQASGRRYRLPTEAEWEFACRAGSSAAFCCGDQSDCVLNYARCHENASGELATVGLYQPNEWGLYDMHGNVWEWVSDWYGPYPTTDGFDPTGPAKGEQKVVRGGCYDSVANNCRAALRVQLDQADHTVYVGFRVVLLTDANK